MKIGVISFLGSNCDRDAILVLQNQTSAEVVKLWHDLDAVPNDINAIILPGGFSYGDYLRSGAIAARTKIMQNVVTRARAGNLLVLGICNGFQILTETGLLPGTLLRNKNMKFIAKNMMLEVVNNNNRFTKLYKQNERIELPIAHGEGNYFLTADELLVVERNKQVVLRYFGENPNGSINNIAAISNKEGNVLGMMPHPERAADKAIGGIDGIRLLLGVASE